MIEIRELTLTVRTGTRSTADRLHVDLFAVCLSSSPDRSSRPLSVRSSSRRFFWRVFRQLAAAAALTRSRWRKLKDQWALRSDHQHAWLTLKTTSCSSRWKPLEAARIICDTWQTSDGTFYSLWLLFFASEGNSVPVLSSEVKMKPSSIPQNIWLPQHVDSHRTVQIQIQDIR